MSAVGPIWWSRELGVSAEPDGNDPSSAWVGLTGRGAGNLALHAGGDDPAAVRTARDALARAARVEPDHLIFLDQVHGCDVMVVEGPQQEPPVADAAVTTRPGIALAVLSADCVPVVLADPGAGVVAVAHAGRNGMVDGVVAATLDVMRSLGARDTRAVVGPSVCARCYEVPRDLRDEVAAVVPLAASVSATGTPAIDVVAGVLDQLATRSVPVELVRGCTRERDDLFSFRRDGAAAGRFATVVRRGVPG